MVLDLWKQKYEELLIENAEIKINISDLEAQHANEMEQTSKQHELDVIASSRLKDHDLTEQHVNDTKELEWQLTQLKQDKELLTETHMEKTIELELKVSQLEQDKEELTHKHDEEKQHILEQHHVELDSFQQQVGSPYTGILYSIAIRDIPFYIIMRQILSIVQTSSPIIIIHWDTMGF